MSDKELLPEQLEFNITAKNKKLKLSYKQIVVLLEALWDFKESIQDIAIDTEEFLRKRILQNKKEEVDELFSILQDSIDYNFQKHLEKCSKKAKEDDPGMETMSWLDKKEKEK